MLACALYSRIIFCIIDPFYKKNILEHFKPIVCIIEHNRTLFGQIISNMGHNVFQFRANGKYFDNCVQLLSKTIRTKKYSTARLQTVFRMIFSFRVSEFFASKASIMSIKSSILVPLYEHKNKHNSRFYGNIARSPRIDQLL